MKKISIIFIMTFICIVLVFIVSCNENKINETSYIGSNESITTMTTKQKINESSETTIVESIETTINKTTNTTTIETIDITTIETIETTSVETVETASVETVETTTVETVETTTVEAIETTTVETIETTIIETTDTSAYESTETTSKEPTEIIDYEDIYDFEMKYKPTEEQLNMIHKGMYFYDVINILGKPHSYPDHTGIGGMRLEWISSEGDKYAIDFLNDGYLPPYPYNMTFTLSVRVKHWVVYNGPIMVSFNFSDSPISSNEKSYTISGVNYYEILNHKDHLDMHLFITSASTHVTSDSIVYYYVNNQMVDITPFCIFPND